MQPEPVRAHESSVLTGMPLQVGERGPVVLAGRSRLDKDEVPVLLGVARDPERQGRPAGRDRDRARESLERAFGPLRDGELLAGARGRSIEEIGVERVPEPDPVVPVGAQVELTDGGRRQVGRHRLFGVPEPRRPSALVLRRSRTPFATASRPAGTVMRNVYAALSLG
jgi:hypothetical protein